MEFTERMEAGRNTAAAKRHRGLVTGKSAAGWNAKKRYDDSPGPDEMRAMALRGWDSDRDTALAVYTSLVFPGRHHVPEFDGYREPTMDDVMAARDAAARASLLATF